MVKIGQEVPEFEMAAFQDDEIKDIRLSDYKGKWVVVVFYPADFTFVCPTELEDVAALYPKFQTHTQMFLTVTDGFGNFYFDGVPAGNYEAVIAEFSAEDSRPVPVSVPEQESYQHDFRF